MCVGEQKAYLPTGSLEAAGASGAGRCCAETKTPTLDPGCQPGQSPLARGTASLQRGGSSLEKVAHWSAEKH